MVLLVPSSRVASNKLPSDFDQSPPAELAYTCAEIILLGIEWYILRKLVILAALYYTPAQRRPIAVRGRRAKPVRSKN